MKSLRNQSGFSAFEGILIVLLVAVVGYAGYYVYQKQNSNDEVYEPVITQPAKIENAQDLQNAQNDLDSINIDELDTSELEAAEAEML